MTSIPVDLHKNLGNGVRQLPAIPEPWTLRDTVLFSVIGLVLFNLLFACMFSLGNM